MFILMEKNFEHILKNFQKCNLPPESAVRNNHGRCVLVESHTNNMLFGEIDYNKNNTNFYILKRTDGKEEILFYNDLKNIFTNRQ